MRQFPLGWRIQEAEKICCFSFLRMEGGQWLYKLRKCSQENRGNLLGTLIFTPSSSSEYNFGGNWFTSFTTPKVSSPKQKWAFCYNCTCKPVSNHSSFFKDDHEVGAVATEKDLKETWWVNCSAVESLVLIEVKLTLAIKHTCHFSLLWVGGKPQPKHKFKNDSLWPYLRFCISLRDD